MEPQQLSGVIIPDDAPILKRYLDGAAQPDEARLRGDDDDQTHVTKPSHYARWKIEPITFIMRNAMDFWLGNVIKYICRAGAKIYDGMDARQSEITDLKKASRYIEMRINHLEGRSEL